MENVYAQLKAMPVGKVAYICDKKYCIYKHSESFTVCDVIWGNSREFTSTGAVANYIAWLGRRVEYEV